MHQKAETAVCSSGFRSYYGGWAHARMSWHLRGKCKRGEGPGAELRPLIGNVRYWHKADIHSCTAHVRFRG